MELLKEHRTDAQCLSLSPQLKADNGSSLAAGRDRSKEPDDLLNDVSYLLVTDFLLILL